MCGSVGMCCIHACVCFNAVCGFGVKPCVLACVALVYSGAHGIKDDI